MIRFNCPQCKAQYDVADDLAGKKVQCDACECKFVIPSAPPARKTAGRGKFPLVLAAIALLAAVAGGWLNLRKIRNGTPEPVAPVSLMLVTNAAADGILHQWNFDETRDWHDSPFGPLTNAPTAVLDLAGGWDLKPVGLAATNWVSGREYMAVELPGGAAHLESTRDLAGDLGGTASLAFWLRTRQQGGADCRESPGVTGAVSPKRKSDIQWGWLNENGCIVLSAHRSILAAGKKPIHDGQWHFLVLTRDAQTGAGQLYVDGALEDSRTGPTGDCLTGFHSIGCIEGSTSGLIGRLDKVTVFNRILSAGEVREFMENHAPKAWPCETDGSGGRPFVTASVLFRAYDAETDTLSVRGWTRPSHGTATYNGDGTFTYTAAPGFTGQDRFDAVIQDGHGGFRLAELRVSVVGETAGGGLPTVRFVRMADAQADGAPISHKGWRVPRICDWDGDGVPDLLIGAEGAVWFHRNNGTKTAPQFAAGVAVRLGSAEVRSGDGLCPIAVADMTGDGTTELIVADASRKLQVYGKTGRFTVRQPDGSDFVLPDRRFDIGDWDGDSRPDLVTGTGSGDVRLFLNAGTATDARFRESRVLFSGSYNLCPRFCDLDGNGRTDLARGINWGGVSYWLDVGAQELSKGGELVMLRADGAGESLRATDGVMADFGDLNSDGITDLVTGGHVGDRIEIAYGSRPGVRDCIGKIEAVYNATPGALGIALSADNDALLNPIREAIGGLVYLAENGSPAVRDSVYAALTAHVRKYPFLKYQELDTKQFHHVPGIALQNWVLLTYSRPDTPAHRLEVSDTMGLTGTVRQIYLNAGLAVGDNGHLDEAQRGTVRDMMLHQPRELFPDAVITFDQLFGDGRGGFVWTPNSTKNTFGCGVGMANEWAHDLTQAIEAADGKGAADGDYFTFVMGHEVTHSMDGYVRNRANRDLTRRWGQMLCSAAGPDIVAGATGWIDWEATKKHFRDAGYYSPPAQDWNEAWKTYWEKGPGAKFRHTSFMRGGIDWFLSAAQESLATQANHHWASGTGRLIGAVARFRRGVATGNLPEKANITEVVDFIDYLSVGMNRVALPKTTTVREPEKKVVWTMHLADLERDDSGRITRIEVDNRTYDFKLDARGTVTDVRCSPAL
jgi:hypothetical protein